MYCSFACMYTCLPCVCLVPAEVRGGCLISWNWSYGCLGATMRLRKPSLYPLQEQLMEINIVSAFMITGMKVFSRAVISLLDTFICSADSTP